MTYTVPRRTPLGVWTWSRKRLGNGIRGNLGPSTRRDDLRTSRDLSVESVSNAELQIGPRDLHDNVTSIFL